jgi:hypothetical protein
MKTFKFFQKQERVFTDWMDQMDDYHLGGIRPQEPAGPTTTQLHRYHKRVLDRYVHAFNLNPGQPNYNAGGLIYETVIRFINNGQLTSYNEIRSYYRIAYEYLNHGEDLISDEDHEDFVRMVEYETRFYL